MNLKGKVAIVTGSRRGIGKAIAIEMAREGADVVISDVSLEECNDVCKEIKNLGRRSLAVKCDVSKRKDVENLFKQAKKKFGTVDILVNNAGIYRTIPLTKMTEKDWDLVIDVNLKSVFLCTQSFVKQLGKKKGSVVSIASIAGEVGFANSSAYCASKAGIITLTKELAMELSPNIRVNAVGPGPIRTPMTKFIEKDKKVLAGIIAGVPLGRMGEPEEIAKAVVFLAGDNASYITGHTLFVDGGWISR